MGNEQTKLATNTWATVAIAAGAIAFKQAAFDGQPIEFVGVLLGAGLVIGYLDWRRRQGDPGLTPERLAQTGPAPGGVARVPVLATIVIGTFCLLHWFFAFMVLVFYFGLATNKAKAGGDSSRPLSQVLGELLIVDDAPKPTVPTPTPVVREAAPAREKKAPTRSLTFDRPAAEPPMVITPVASVPEAEERAPLAPTGFSLPMTSVLDSRASLELESRIPLVLESRLSAMTGSLGTISGMSSGPSGFDEALALLQGKPDSADRPD